MSKKQFIEKYSITVNKQYTDYVKKFINSKKFRNIKEKTTFNEFQ